MTTYRSPMARKLLGANAANDSQQTAQLAGAGATNGATKTKRKARPATAAPSKAATARKSTTGRASSKRKSVAAESATKPKAKRSVSGERKRTPSKRSSNKNGSAKNGNAEDSSAEKGASAGKAPTAPRKLGVRGAAPWVARHAAKQAEQMRRRNAEPAPPGSARATLRVPENVDSIKESVARLHEVVSRIKKLSRKLDKNFFTVGELLRDLQAEGIHTAKGFSTFDAFLDREVAIPRATALRLIRIVAIFQREAAEDYPLDNLFAALQGLDGELLADHPSARSGRGRSARSLPLRLPRG